MDIGKNIRMLRTRRGLKAGELAARLGVSKSYISRIEREHRRVNTDLLEKIGKVLEVPPASLLGDSEGEDPNGLWEEVEALRTLLFKEWMLNPDFVDRSVDWLGHAAFPEGAPFDTAGGWEESFEEVLGGSDRRMRRLLKRFREFGSESLPSRPQPQTPYPRFREGFLAALRGLSPSERADLVTSILPSLLRARHTWPRGLQETPPLVPRPGRGKGEGTFPDTLPKLPPRKGKDSMESLALFPKAERDTLRAAVIEDSAMSPKYEPGDVVIFSTSRAARGGERAVVGLADGRWLVRVFRERGRLVQLTPMNALYEPLFFEPEEVRWAHPVVRSLSD
ncbi:MAG: XRE family transcriptional regulator [Planctomycetota bacterium]|jgi:XRE family transcriptional regulator of biofilm formation